MSYQRSNDFDIKYNNHKSFFSPAHLFLIVTSVTPEAIDISFCVLLPPDEIHERYNAAAAIPIGSFPATIPSFFALFKRLIAFRLVFSPSPAILAILDTPLTGSTTGIFRSSYLKTNL